VLMLAFLDSLNLYKIHVFCIGKEIMAIDNQLVRLNYEYQNNMELILLHNLSDHNVMRNFIQATLVGLEFTIPN